MRNPVIICYGEVLWDVLPDERIPGGAPMNVAFHANNMGVAAHMISRVGKDEAGAELLAFLNQKGVSTHLIQQDDTFPTGNVYVNIAEDGVATYQVQQPAAWDFMQMNEEMRDTIQESDALVFGSLACRSNRSRRTLFELLDNATLRIFDVNLRPPFYSRQLIEALMVKADIVKINRRELDIIAHWFHIGAGEMERMAFLKRRFDLDAIILTKGDQGAISMNGTGYCIQPGIGVQVKDTVGTGDAFLAGYLSRMLAGDDDRQCLEFANAIGALTATQSGGTPDLYPQEVWSLLDNYKKIIY